MEVERGISERGRWREGSVREGGGEREKAYYSCMAQVSFEP